MTTDLTADRLRAARLAEELRALQVGIERRERECPHNRSEQYWSEPKETIKTVTASEPDSARPVFQGIDVAYYETRDVPRLHRTWSRRCQLCGTEQTTEATRMVSQAVPDFARR